MRILQFEKVRPHLADLAEIKLLLVDVATSALFGGLRLAVAARVTA